MKGKKKGFKYRLKRVKNVFLNVDKGFKTDWFTKNFLFRAYMKCKNR